MYTPSHFIIAVKQLCLPNGIVLAATKHMTIPNGRFSKRRACIFCIRVSTAYYVKPMKLFYRKTIKCFYNWN